MSLVIYTVTYRTSRADSQVLLAFVQVGGRKTAAPVVACPREQRQRVLRSQIELSDNDGVYEQITIEITVNGESQRVAAQSSVTDLIALLDLTAQRLAIELNLSILPRVTWADTRLQDGDKLEIVHFVGGG